MNGISKISKIVIILALAIIFIVLAIIFYWANYQKNPNQTTKPDRAPKQLSFTNPPPITIDPNKSYQAVIHTTAGDIIIDLLAKDVPRAVNNFVFLANQGFYKDTYFHRIIKGFMIQGGDPTGTGSGGPGYKFANEKVVGKYTKGTVAYANAGPNTNGSQFFIMQEDDNLLVSNYVIFGKVVKGMDVVDTIANTPVTQSEVGEMSKPTQFTYIDSVEIVTQ